MSNRHRVKVLQRETDDSQHSFLRRLFVRAMAGCCSAALVVLLIVASRLEPNPAGLGTHQQLGLPPCTMRVLMGVRCPACGMTTSWSHFVRGQWASSIQVNLGGFLLALTAIFFVFVGIRTCCSGRLPSADVQKYASLAILAIATISVIEWGGRLVVERFL